MCGLFSKFKVLDSCGTELAALKQSIRELENKLLVEAWQVRHLKMHKYFQPFHQTLQSQTDKGMSTTSGKVDSTDIAQMRPFPSAGSLIVHDKGKLWLK